MVSRVAVAATGALTETAIVAGRRTLTRNVAAFWLSLKSVLTLILVQVWQMFCL